MKPSNQNQAGRRLSFPEFCRCVSRNFKHRLRDIKSAIAAEFRDRMGRHGHVLNLALNEAEALAWESGYPQLLFPTLALEKASTVAAWHDRQQSILPPPFRMKLAA